MRKTMENPLQEQYRQFLLERIRAARYPSVTYMDLLESIATPGVLVEYTLHLMERIEADAYPSVPMMRRVQRLSSLWGLEQAPG
jgi:hypothetical protein